MSIFLIVICVLILIIGSYFYTNITYIEKTLKKIEKAGFKEKQMQLNDGTTLNYGEGPKNGKQPLLLIHGQGMTWEDYAHALPILVEHYHVYAVDCHGHGESSYDSDKYTAKAMGADFIEFIDRQIGKKVVLSGHSSGGMIAAWMAAKYPEYVIGTVIEDAPFFATEPGRREDTFVWKYEFQMYENFKKQQETKDYFTYYLEHSYWKKLFGSFLWNRFSKDAIKYHEQHPNKPVRLFYLPPQMNRIFETATYPYDRKFGEAFYDHRWFQDYDQVAILSEIKTPTVFIKAKTNYDGDMLLAALSDEDTASVVSLLENGKRVDIDTPGHDIHYDKPKEFTQVLIDFSEEIKKPLI